MNSHKQGELGESRFRREMGKYKNFITVPPKRVIPFGAKGGKKRVRQEEGVDFWVHSAQFLREGLTSDLPVEVKTHEWKSNNKAIIALSDFSKTQKRQLHENNGWVWLTITHWQGGRFHADFLIPWDVLTGHMGKRKSIKARAFARADEAGDGYPDGALAVWRANPVTVKAFVETVALRQLIGLAHTAEWLGWHSREYGKEYNALAEALFALRASALGE